MATRQRPEIHRTTIDLDVKALEEAKFILGTTGYRDTVNAALREVARIVKLRRLADKIRAGEAFAPTPEELAEMRRPRGL